MSRQGRLSRWKTSRNVASFDPIGRPGTRRATGTGVVVSAGSTADGLARRTSGPPGSRATSGGARWSRAQRLAGLIPRAEQTASGPRPSSPTEQERLGQAGGEPVQAARRTSQNSERSRASPGAPPQRPGQSRQPPRRSKAGSSASSIGSAPAGRSRATRRRWSSSLCRRIPTSQVRSVDRPENRPRPRRAARKVSCTRSAARSASRTCIAHSGTGHRRACPPSGRGRSRRSHLGPSMVLRPGRAEGAVAHAMPTLRKAPLFIRNGRCGRFHPPSPYTRPPLILGNMGMGFVWKRADSWRLLAELHRLRVPRLPSSGACPGRAGADAGHAPEDGRRGTRNRPEASESPRLKKNAWWRSARSVRLLANLHHDGDDRGCHAHVFVGMRHPGGFGLRPACPRRRGHGTQFRSPRRLR